MKTQIIQLDRHDDVISARDKITWGKSARILLVWPKRGRILMRRLDLVLLQRHSATVGAQLGVVTRNPEVSKNARLLGIPTFSNIDQAQRSAWRRERRRAFFRPEPVVRPDLRAERAALHPALAGWAENSWLRAGVFLLGVLSILALMALLYPSANVVLLPAAHDQEITLKVHASPDISAVNLSGNVPARVETVVVEGQDSLTATGSTAIPDQAASGIVQFVNLTEQPVDIPAGTVVRSLGASPVRFATTTSGSLDSGVGQSISLPVQALAPGVEGNLPAESLQAIEGSLGLSLKVDNSAATAGGSSRTAPAPSASDRAQLRGRLMQTLRQKALEDLRAKLGKDDQALQNTLQVKDVLNETSSPAQDEPADHLDLDMRIEYSVQVVAGEDLLRLAESSLDAGLPAGYRALPDTLSLSNASDPVSENEGGTTWQMKIDRKVEATLPDGRMTQLVLGLTPQKAGQRIAAALPMSAPPVFQLNPSWWPWLPFLSFRISFQSG